MNLLNEATIDETEAGHVIVGEKIRPLHAYTQHGHVQELGNVVTRNYRGEQAARHYFIGKDEKGVDKTYKLGVTTSRFQFVDHTVALDPLLNRGYTIKDTVISRGGMNMYAVLERPNAQEIADPMNWDLQFWHDETGSGTKVVPRTMTESIVVFSSIKPGKAINYRRGYYRLICSNGLVAEVLDLGHIKANHAAWSHDLISSHLNLLPTLSETIEWGAYAGSPHGCLRFARLLGQLAELPDTAEFDEDGTQPLTIEAVVLELPLFIRDLIKPILSMPSWFRSSIAAQFTALAEVERKIFALDVVNAVTNPINIERGQVDPHSVLAPLVRANVITTAATKMIGAFSL